MEEQFEFNITDFPIEIMMRIFSFMGIKDLCQCGQVCKSWKMISNLDSIWSRIAQKNYKNISKGHSNTTWKEVMRYKPLVDENWQKSNYNLIQFKGHLQAVINFKVRKNFFYILL
eukprot:TRINITY_DN5924_c0_g1_i1.p1 TRINITY_DN5924_c0_g1~~TRINITY_DN5924_c0_g1_i1.p1  ORF type:complete len:115 (-),score=12.86 TRINITY_DN5924_c0_g1_i1:177-521(-)